MADAVVRRAEESDWALVREVRLRALTDSPGAFGSTLLREVAFDDTVWRQRVGPGNWVLAQVEDVTVGVAAGVREPGQSETERSLMAMWVAPEWRGHEVAAALVEEVQRWTTEQGAATLTLWVADDNHRARRFYERVGFEPTEQRQPLPSDPTRGEERMTRSTAVKS